MSLSLGSYLPLNPITPGLHSPSSFFPLLSVSVKVSFGVLSVIVGKSIRLGGYEILGIKVYDQDDLAKDSHLPLGSVVPSVTGRLGGMLKAFENRAQNPFFLSYLIIIIRE